VLENGAEPDDSVTFPDVVALDLTVEERGKRMTLHVYRPAGAAPAIPLIYGSGDGGWRGLAPRTAEEFAHAGAAVVGVDTKKYLETFASLDQPVTVALLSEDYRRFAVEARKAAVVSATAPVVLAGWSLGAGFALAVAADKAHQPEWAGVISIGPADGNQLAPGVDADRETFQGERARLGFHSSTYAGAVSPLRLAIIQAKGEHYVKAPANKSLLAAAREPKRYVLVDARNHRYSGGRDEFFKALRDALVWVSGKTASGGRTK
jgi:alpha-beta hydrolase superfamily lysophospholipase